MIGGVLLAGFMAMMDISQSDRRTVEAFPLSEVRLTGGPFSKAEAACLDYLLKVEPNRLLHSFRVNSGLEPKGKQYGGWETSGLAGHSLGHYLTACSQAYATTNDRRFKEKVEVIVSDLMECQKNRPDGYIGAIPDGDKAWAEIKKGDIRSKGFDLNGMWSPWYTEHKILAGLLDAYRIIGSRDALKVAEKFTGWVIEETKGLDEAQWQKMLVTEYGGMNDALAELYAITKNKLYLELARKFYDKHVLDPLGQAKDELGGKHSNTQIPKVVGLARLYELTGELGDKAKSEFFWESVVRHHTYAIGGNSDHEYLGLPDKLSDALSSNTCESCNTYNMLKLSQHLFEWQPSVERADYYERAHLNHMLASQNPATGMMTYFMPLVSGSHREYSNAENDWTCCHGSGMETHSKHADSVYFHRGKDRLFVSQFIPTELSWKENNLKLVQETNFPNDGLVRLKLVLDKPKKLTIMVRHPSWAEGEIAFQVNGEKFVTSKERGNFVSLERTWKTGDRVDFEIPMKLRTEAMPDNPKRVALMYGPVVLSADLGSKAISRVPVLVTENKPVSEWLEKTSGSEIEFRTKGTGRPGELTFRPFYSIHTNRYATYFDEFTQEEWNRYEGAYRAEEDRQRDLVARTIDFARIGEMQPERDHKLKSEKCDVRSVNGRGFRTALDGGWMSFEMKVDQVASQELVLTYWGNPRIKPDFVIEIDGKPLAEEKSLSVAANTFLDKTYQISEDMAKGKTSLTVRIKATDHKASASICGARIVKKAN